MRSSGSRPAITASRGEGCFDGDRAPLGREAQRALLESTSLEGRWSPNSERVARTRWRQRAARSGTDRLRH